MDSLDTIVGQAAAKERLRQLAEYCSRNNAELPHVLIVGPSGTGKRTIALSLASELRVPIKIASGLLLKKKGDLTAILTALDEKEVLFLEDVHEIPRRVREVLPPVLAEYRIDLTIGRGPSARVHPFKLCHFTCVMTAPSESSVPEDIRRSAALTLALEGYSVADLTKIASRVAEQNGVTIEPEGAAALARSSGGVPGQLEEIVKRLARTKQGTISGEEISEFLSVFGLGNGLAGSVQITDSPEPVSGVEFEREISALLARMGFRCEMTKTTGDGGIDIVATLNNPVVGGRYLIQCKRYAPGALVGAPTVREFYGAVTADTSAVKGILITTSDFTDQAREFAERVRIELIGGEVLKRLLADHAG